MDILKDKPLYGSFILCDLVEMYLYHLRKLAQINHEEPNATFFNNLKLRLYFKTDRRAIG